MTALSHKQRVVITIGGAFIALMFLFPPFKYYGRHGAAGYGFIFDSLTRFRLDLSTPSIVTESNGEVYIDTVRLFVQCAFVGMLTAGIVFLMGKRD